MSEETSAPSPAPDEIESALAEYEKAHDRVAVIKKYPFLVPILNNPQPKK